MEILGCHKTLGGAVLQLLGDMRLMQVGEGLTDEDTEEQGRGGEVSAGVAEKRPGMGCAKVPGRVENLGKK